MAKNTKDDADLLHKKKKKALDMMIDGSESFLGQLKQSQKEKKKKPAIDKTNPAYIAKQKRKKMIYGGSALAVFVVLGFFVHWLGKPGQGSIYYGACKTFLELQVQFPDYLRLANVIEKQEKDFLIVGIWHSRVDGFGQNNMERMDCYFAQNEDKRIILSKALINDRRPVAQEEIDRFSAVLPTVLSMEMNLDYPLDFPSRIADLKFDPNAFRTQIFGRR